jgi:hypothetical protein
MIAARPLPIVATPALEVEFLTLLMLRGGAATLGRLFERPDPDWPQLAPTWAMLTLDVLIDAGAVVRDEKYPAKLIATEAGARRVGRTILKPGAVA